MAKRAKASPRGRFIIIEGIDGTGKSTLAKAVAAKLRERGRKVRLTHEPTDKPSGKLILERLADHSIKISPEEWLGMFVADRRINIDMVVKPALEKGIDIIQDRSMYSTLVYQGEMGIAPREIMRRHKGWHPAPDLLVIMDIAPRFGLARTRRRSMGVGQRWVRQKDQTYLFKDADAPQTTEKLHFLQALRRRYRRIKGDFVLHLPAREKRKGEWYDRPIAELRDEVLKALTSCQ